MTYNKEKIRENGNTILELLLTLATVLTLTYWVWGK